MSLVRPLIFGTELSKYSEYHGTLIWCFRVLFFLACLIVGTVLLTGCAVNPVTGEQELSLIPESMEIAMGEENYLPGRQLQGGDYVVHPEVVEYIREVGSRLAAVSDRKLPYEFAVVNDSEINAWMMPGGKMAVNRGLLLKLNSEAELAAVMSHEIVHAAAKHTARQIQQEIIIQGAVILGSMAIEANTDKDWVKGIGAIGLQTAGILLSAKFSRDDETEADHYGMLYMSRAGYDPKAAIVVQELLMKESGRGDDLLTRLLSTHPVSADRVAAARAYSAKLPAGEWGRKRYRQRLAALFRDAPAYEAYDKARKAYEKGDYRTARSLVDEAIRLQPKEAVFHLLKGDIYQHVYDEEKALREFKLAARLNPGYYQPHLKLGLLLEAMGRRRQARMALENSIKLVKTAAALRRLGNYALEEGNIQGAKNYFKQAIESDSEDGRAAYAELLRIDLPNNAGEYLSAEIGLREGGVITLTINNPTPFPVRVVVVEVSDPTGSTRINVNDVIPANSSKTFRAGQGATQQQVDTASARVLSARLAM